MALYVGSKEILKQAEEWLKAVTNVGESWVWIFSPDS